jgi:sec-independent protein translocase protein TatA
MGRLGLPELLVILVIVIIIFGANRLPELGKGIGSAIKNFKNATTDPDEVTSTTSSAAFGTCASCGTVNPGDSRFCRKCGNKLSL